MNEERECPNCDEANTDDNYDGCCNSCYPLLYTLKLKEND